MRSATDPPSVVEHVVIENSEFELGELAVWQGRRVNKGRCERVLTDTLEDAKRLDAVGFHIYHIMPP